MSSPSLPTDSVSTSTTLSMSESASTSSTSLHSNDDPGKGGLAPRRSLAVYPHSKAINNSTPYAESAKRRNSLQSLGSIAHLQHLYTRQGLASKVKPSVLKRAHPALGQAAVEPLTPEEGLLPKTPLAPTQSSQNAESSLSRPPTLDELKREALAAWRSCCHQWAFNDLLETDGSAHEIGRDDMEEEIELRRLIFVTREAIRRIRDYFLAIPQEKLGDVLITREQSSRKSRQRPAFRRQSSFFCSPRQEVGYSNTEANSTATRLSPNKQRSEGNLREDGGAQEPTFQSQSALISKDTNLIRPAALEVLIQLKQLESERFEKERDESTSLEVSFPDLSLAIRDGAEDHFGVREERVSLRDLQKERECVRQYLELAVSTINKIKSSERGAADEGDNASSKVRVSPPWSAYEAGQGLAGALEVVRDFVGLDKDAQLHLNDDNRRPVLEALSDGVILCQAFNAAVSASSRPWDQIKVSDVNHFNGIDGSWTFRKRHNLTVWTAALKAKYSISAASFDAVLVAKGGPAQEWLDMLQSMICKWAQAVAKEHTV